jgi:hypothetical protein
VGAALSENGTFERMPSEEYAVGEALAADPRPHQRAMQILRSMRLFRRHSGESEVVARFARHGITVKKSAGGGVQRADVARARRRWICEQGFLTRPTSYYRRDGSHH